VNTEERQLSDLLHRLTPEPPRRVTVEDVAFRLANQAGRGRAGYHEPRPRRGTRRFGGRGLVPALAALSVFAVAGLSAGVAVLVSHHGAPPAASLGGAATTTSAPASASSSAPATSAPVTTGPATSPSAIEGGPFGAELIDHHTFTQDSLVAGDNALYAIASGSLARIDPATGVVTSVPVQSPASGPPVVVGDTVWVVSFQPGGVIDLQGYDASTLARVASAQVTGLGAPSSTIEGGLAAGPDGTLYVAAGVTVVAVDPSTGQAIHRYYLNSSSASSVAVSPDGSTLYVGSGSFKVTKFDVTGGEVIGESTMNVGGVGGNLVATPRGLWGTVGVGMSEWVWFAPNGDLSRAARVSQGAGAGLASVPVYSGGHVWIGGGQTLVCADPSTGQVLASANLPTDNGVLEYFSSVAVTGGQAYAYYLDQASQRSGIVRMTLPAAC
jgi:outer membrane protein assembly factor BamB